MKLLKISDSCGHFRNASGDYVHVDKINRDDLLRLVSWTLDEADVECDPYDETKIQHQAHQVIYKSIVQKLQSLRARKQNFIDESARLYLEDYDKYRSELRGTGSSA